MVLDKISIDVGDIDTDMGSDRDTMCGYRCACVECVYMYVHIFTKA